MGLQLVHNAIDTLDRDKWLYLGIVAGMALAVQIMLISHESGYRAGMIDGLRGKRVDIDGN